MNNRRKVIRAIAVLSVALLVSMALPTSATHDNKGSKVHKDPDGKLTYINAGVIGDIFVACPGDITVTVLPNGANSVQVVVNDPTDENNPELVNTTVPIPGGPYGPFPVTVPDQRVCLGGGLSVTSGATVPTIPGYWQVWAEDFVYQALKTATGGAVDIVPAMFVRMTAEAHRSLGSSTVCTPSGSSTRVCETTSTSETQFKVLTQFSACGKGEVDGISTTAFDDLIAAKGTYDSYELTKAVFTVGPILFMLDCGLGGSTLAPLYNDFVHWYNNDPGNQPTGPFSDLPDPSVTINGDDYGSTCNPGLPTGGFVCFFELPAGTSTCWNSKYQAGHTAAAPGIIGTIGWNHDDTGNLNCSEPLTEGPWTKTIRTSKSYGVQNFPVDVNINNP